MPVWKKPRANLPLPKTSLSSPVNGRPRESVSVVMEYEGVCCWDKRIQQRTTARRERMAKGMKERRATGQVASLLAAIVARIEAGGRVLSR